MKTFLILCFTLLLVSGLYSICEAESWNKFFTNMVGYEFFYDKDSIVYPDKNTVQVWYKSVPTEKCESKVWEEYIELREVDCTRRRYKRLAGRITFRDEPMKTLEESTWIYSEPGDLDDAFYITVCKRKNK
ncbi:MAG: hypothetical protein WC560_09020 [Syntrophales bacterium]